MTNSSWKTSERVTISFSLIYWKRFSDLSPVNGRVLNRVIEKHEIPVAISYFHTWPGFTVRYLFWVVSWGEVDTSSSKKTTQLIFLVSLKNKLPVCPWGKPKRDVTLRDYILLNQTPRVGGKWVVFRERRISTRASSLLITVSLKVYVEKSNFSLSNTVINVGWFTESISHTS